MGYDTFEKLCAAKGVTPYRVAKETGIYHSERRLFFCRVSLVIKRNLPSERFRLITIKNSLIE